MGPAVNVLLAAGTSMAVAFAPTGALAEEEAGPLAEEEAGHWGSLDGVDWAPSLAVTGGVVVQRLSGRQKPLLFDGDGPPGMEVVPLREALSGDDLVVSPSVGGVFELLTPELALPGRPRLLFGAELVPIFGSDRQLTQDGEPNRIRGPEVGAVLAVDEPMGDDTIRFNPFGESEANGQGNRTTATFGRIAYGAHAGAAFPFEVFGRSLRLRPVVGWLRFEVEGEGLLVNPACDPTIRCTDQRNPQNEAEVFDGFLRETILRDSDEEWFDGFGPGLEVEMDTGRFGPLSTALFLGVRAYYVPGNREIIMRDSVQVADQISDPGNPDDPMITDTTSSTWKIRVAPWMVRAGLGLRVYWGGRR